MELISYVDSICFWTGTRSTAALWVFFINKNFLMIVHFLYFCDNADQLFASGILPDSTY